MDRDYNPFDHIREKLKNDPEFRTMYIYVNSWDMIFECMKQLKGLEGNEHGRYVKDLEFLEKKAMAIWEHSKARFE